MANTNAKRHTNSQQNTTQKTKDLAPRTQLKTRANLGNVEW